MANSPKISVITVVFNGEKDIEQCILSVASQHYPNKEHLVVDGLSTDSTMEIVRKYADQYPYIRWVSEKDYGIYDAMNKGIDLADGEWIYFLGSDDTLHDDSVLEKILGSTDICSYDLVYGNVLWGNTGEVYGGEFSLFKLMLTNICQQAIFYKRGLFSKLGKFETRYKYCADYFFNIKCFNDTDVKIKYVDHVVARYSAEGASTTVVDDVFLREKPLIYNKYFPAACVEAWEKYRVLSAELEDSNNQIVHLNWYLNERDLQLEEKERQLQEYKKCLQSQQMYIESLLSSVSWKITSPLRLFVDFLVKRK